MSYLGPLGTSTHSHLRRKAVDLISGSLWGSKLGASGFSGGHGGFVGPDDVSADVMFDGDFCCIAAILVSSCRSLDADILTLVEVNWKRLRWQPMLD